MWERISKERTKRQYGKLITNLQGRKWAAGRASATGPKAVTSLHSRLHLPPRLSNNWPQQMHPLHLSSAHLSASFGIHAAMLAAQVVQSPDAWPSPPAELPAPPPAPRGPGRPLTMTLPPTPQAAVAAATAKHPHHESGPAATFRSSHRVLTQSLCLRSPVTPTLCTRRPRGGTLRWNSCFATCTLRPFPPL